MLKKVVYGITAASLVLAAQVAPADDTQFWTGDRYQGVTALPFHAFSTEAQDRRDAVAETAAPQIERVMPREGSTQMVVVPAPYDSGAAYFN